MMAKAQDQEMTVGTVVRNRKWGGRHTGTVVRRDGDSVFVAWHNSCVEDELDLDEVDTVPDAAEELAVWRGGIGVVNADGTYTVRDVTDLRP